MTTTTAPFDVVIPPLVMHDLPEAPCSVNGHLDLPAIGRVQVTGRGYTGEEAAENFSTTAAAMQQHYAPKTPTLGRILDAWLHQIGDECAKTPTIERLMEAVTLVATSRVEADPSRPNEYFVNDGPLLLSVGMGEAPDCECASIDKRCRHILAAQIYAKILGG